MKTSLKLRGLTMNKLKLPKEYIPYEKVWVCRNIFNKGLVLFEVEGNPVFLIGKGGATAHSRTWLNFPKPVGGKPRWVKAIENNHSLEPGFDFFESPEGDEISFNGVPLLQYYVKEEKLFITLINLIPVGLNIFGGLKSITFSGTTIKNNNFENVHTMVTIGVEI